MAPSRREFYVDDVGLTQRTAELAPLAELIAAALDMGATSLVPFAEKLDPSRHRTINLADCFRSMRELVLSYGEETFALSERPMMAGTSELVFSRAAGARSLLEAMREIARTYNVLHGDQFNRVDLRGQTLSYVLDDDRFPYTRPRDGFLHFSLECSLVFLHSAICEIAGEDLGPYVRQISTRRPRTHELSGTLKFWNARVVYDAPVYSVTYHTAMGERPLSNATQRLTADLAVHNRILCLIKSRESLGEPDGRFEAEVRQAFRDGLEEQEAVARHLGLSVATLRRRLAGESASFRSIHREHMRTCAIDLLRQVCRIGAAADALGFSDTRSFTRAFKDWTGLTPSSFLKNETQHATTKV